MFINKCIIYSQSFDGLIFLDTIITVNWLTFPGGCVKTLAKHIVHTIIYMHILCWIPFTNQTFFSFCASKYKSLSVCLIYIKMRVTSAYKASHMSDTTNRTYICIVPVQRIFSWSTGLWGYITRSSILLFITIIFWTNKRYKVINTLVSCA